MRSRQHGCSPEPGLTGGAASACFERCREVAYVEIVRTYQLGCLLPDDLGKGWGWRPRLPMLQLVIEPGRSIDFADPVTGFLGLGRQPPPERVLSIWADDLLSVSHGDDWLFLIDAKRPFDRAWLDLVSPPLGVTYEWWHVAVAASFAGPTPEGRFRIAELDATTYLTRVLVEDHRHPRPEH